MITPVEITKNDIQDLTFDEQTKGKLFEFLENNIIPSDDHLISLIDDSQVSINEETVYKRYQEFESDYFNERENRRLGRAFMPLNNLEGPDPDVYSNIKGNERQVQKQKYLKAIKNEFHSLICTENKDYSEVRKEWKSSFKSMLPIISTAIASSLGIGIALVSGVVTALLITLIKIPTNAWCKTFK